MDTNEDKCFKLLDVRSTFSTLLAMGCLRNHTKTHWWVELTLRKIPFRQQPSFDLVYKGHKIELFVPDLIAFDSVVVDTKVLTESLIANVD